MGFGDLGAVARGRSWCLGMMGGNFACRCGVDLQALTI